MCAISASRGGGAPLFALAGVTELFLFNFSSFISIDAMRCVKELFARPWPLFLTCGFYIYDPDPIDLGNSSGAYLPDVTDQYGRKSINASMIQSTTHRSMDQSTNR